MPMFLFLALLPSISYAAEMGAQRPVELTFAPTTGNNLPIVKNGDVWELTLGGQDPYVLFIENGFAAQDSDVIQIRYRTQGSYDAQMYWSTDLHPRLIEYNFPLNSTEVPGTGALEWQICEIPVGLLSERWSGIITGIRFDPAASRQPGKVEIEWVRIVSRTGENLRKANLPAVRKGEFLSEVVTGISPGSGTRYVENQRFRIETERANLHLSRVDGEGNLQSVARLSVEFDKTTGSGAFSTSDFNSDYLFCKFQDRWRTQVLSLFYQSTDKAEHFEGQIDVTMQSGRAPYLVLSPGGKLQITPHEPLKEVSLPDKTSIQAVAEGQPSVTIRRKARSVTLVVQNSLPVVLNFEKDVEREITVSESAISVSVGPNEMVMLGSGFRRARSSFGAFRRPESYLMMEPQSVTLTPGITAVDAVVEISGGRGRARKLDAPIAFRTTISSDFLDANIPVDVGEVRIEIPAGAKVNQVRDALTHEDIAYILDGSHVVLKNVQARTVRVKCDRLLDYRVMFTGSKPLSGGRFWEDMANYYYPQWLFFWEPQINKKDVLDRLDKTMRERPLPVFLGLHYGNHAPPNFYDTFYKLFPDVKQVDNHGNPHKGLAEGGVTPPWMCLVHPTLWQEIRERLDGIFSIVKSKPWRDRIFAYSSTSEPWIVTERDKSIIYCYNPEHIKWFRQYEKKKWNDDLVLFNRTFGTNFVSWDEVEPPRKVEKSAYYNEWLLAKLESVIASEEFYRGEIYKHDPNRPNFAHMAIMVCYNQIRNSNTPDIMHVGKDVNPEMFKEGGSLYTSDPMVQAFSADSVRAYDTDEVSFPECHGSRYNEMYSYLVGKSGMFKKSFSFMVRTITWSGGNVGNAWQVFSEMKNFLCLDLGDVARPEVGLVYDLLSDNAGALRGTHNALFERNVDRCVITTRMIERGYLASHPLKVLILPDVKMLSEKALSELADAADKGLQIVILGEFATTDCYYRKSVKFTEIRKKVLKHALQPTGFAAVAESLSPVLKTDVTEKHVIYKKSRGFTFYNMWAAKTITVEMPEKMRTGRVAVVSDTGQVVQLRQPAETIKVPIGGMRANSVVLCVGQ